MTLPAPLAPLGRYPHFIAYTLRGKDKLPCDYRTGAVADAHNPAVWSDYATIASASPGRVGFVFSPADPFWFLDIDHCLQPDRTWSPLALEVIALLPGAAIEVSLSGEGLHLFGVGHIPSHSCRGPAGSGLELYHEGRFAALGNQPGATGSADTDCSAGLAEVVRRYFAPKSESSTAAAWTEAPVEGWRGPATDEDLLRRAMATKSAASAFGNKASFADLWGANAEALAKAYPAPEGDRPWDGSSADAALAQHLAFWTGKNCARMLWLMGQSALRRDKWEREDYLPRTIMAACAMQIQVCQDKLPDLPQAAYPVAEVREVQGETYLTSESQKLLFAGCCYIADRNKILLPGGHLYGKEQFDAMLGGFSFVIEQDKVSKSAWEIFTQSRALRFPKAHTSAFRPDKAPGLLWADGNRTTVNTYTPCPVAATLGDVAPFLQHLGKLLPVPGDQAIILSYMAAVVQHPGIKFQWCPLIQGTRGNGKSLLSRCVVEAVGREHSHSPKASEIAAKFNDWQEGKIFIQVEDIYVPKERAEVLEILKPMITSDWQEIEGKNQAKRTSWICCNFMLNSNHKDALRQTEDNRGLAVFFTAQQTVHDLKRDGMGGEYFPTLYRWLRAGGYAAVTHYLRTYPIPAALNPALDCHRAPLTSSTQEAIAESMGSIEQEIEAAILEDRLGFRGGWVSSHYLDLLIREGGVRIARNKRREILTGLGFIPHPGLKNGQVDNVIQPDGNKPRLYVRPGHAAIGLSGAGVGRAYADAQAAQTFNPFSKSA